MSKVYQWNVRTGPMRVEPGDDFQSVDRMIEAIMVQPIHRVRGSVVVASRLRVSSACIGVEA
jgi:hypothetical protein